MNLFSHADIRGYSSGLEKGGVVLYNLCVACHAADKSMLSGFLNTP